MDIRVRMVLLGLVLGVIVAVIVAAQGCGSSNPQKRTFHGTAPRVTNWSHSDQFVTLGVSLRAVGGAGSARA